jgi:hypothetical protein
MSRVSLLKLTDSEELSSFYTGCSINLLFFPSSPSP